MAARVLTGTSRSDHISPVLASLHWLPASLRTDFKFLSFVFKAHFKALYGSSHKHDCLSEYVLNRLRRSCGAAFLMSCLERSGAFLLGF